MLGKYKSTCTFLEKVNAADIVALKVYVFIHLEDCWLQEWTDPGDEAGAFALEIL